MNNKNGYIKPILLLLFAIIFPIALPIVGGIIGIYIALVYPDITYKGDRTVPEKDIIRLEKVTLRDLRLDEYTKYEGSSLFIKYYIVKKNLLSKRKLNDQLSKYCNDYYNNDCNDHDIISFHFYEEAGTMPWFWNNDGYFPDLEMNSENLIAVYWITENDILFREYH